MAERCHIRVFINRAVVRVGEEQEAGAKKPKPCFGMGGGVWVTVVARREGIRMHPSQKQRKPTQETCWERER